MKNRGWNKLAEITPKGVDSALENSRFIRQSTDFGQIRPRRERKFFRTKIFSFWEKRKKTLELDQTQTELELSQLELETLASEPIWFFRQSSWLL